MKEISFEQKLDWICDTTNHRLDILKDYMRRIYIPCIAEKYEDFMPFDDYEAWHILFKRSGGDVRSLNISFI